MTLPHHHTGVLVKLPEIFRTVILMQPLWMAASELIDYCYGF